MRNDLSFTSLLADLSTFPKLLWQLLAVRPPSDDHGERRNFSSISILVGLATFLGLLCPLLVVLSHSDDHGGCNNFFSPSLHFSWTCQHFSGFWNHCLSGSWWAQQFLFHFTSRGLWFQPHDSTIYQIKQRAKQQASRFDMKKLRKTRFSLAHYWRSIVVTSLHFKGHTKVVLPVRNSSSRTHQFRLRVMR